MKERYVWNRRGNGLVEIETYKDRNHRFYKSTGVRCDQWDAARGRAVGPGSEEVNRRLDMFAQGIITGPARRERTSSPPFAPWMNQKICTRKLADNTRRIHLSVLRNVKDYGGSLTFDDITPRWLAGWNDHLVRKGCADSSVYLYHATLACYLRIAVREGVIDASPYDRYKADQPKRRERRSLTAVQLQSLRDLSLRGRMAIGRDLFLLQAATGMAYVDVKNMDMKKVEDGWYEARRVKTGQRFLAPIGKEAAEILARYGGVPPLTLPYYDQVLDMIGKSLGLPFKLTSHIARHTFVTLALEKGVPPTVVQKMAGHASITMTETYMHPNDDFIKNGAKALF